MAKLAARAVGLLWLVLVGGPAAAADPPVAPPPRAVEARPFDLTHVPPGCGAEGHPRLLVAVRPGAVLRHPAAGGLAAAADRALGGLAREWLGAAAARGPGFDAVESVIFAGHVTVVRNGDAERPNSLIGSANGVVVRTRGRFDWAAAVAAWYPAAKTVRHHGAALTLIPVPEPLSGFFPPDAVGALCAAHAPDDRTLVLGPEDAVRRLIDRTRAGEAAPRPAGWNEVERADLAIAVEVPDRGVIDRFPAQDAAEAKAAFEVARLTRTAAFGAWAGDRTAVKLALETRSPRDARRVARLLKQLGPAVDGALREQQDDDDRSADEKRVADGLLALAAAGRVGRAGAVVRVRATAPGNLLDHLVPILKEWGTRPVEWD